jgi:endonuclease/exonuclease/phosphatase family metal-dependent hydrolase
MVIKVCSLNIDWKSLDDSKAGGQKQVSDNAVALARTIESDSYDFIALQEAKEYRKITDKLSARFTNNMEIIDKGNGNEHVITFYNKNYDLENTVVVNIGADERLCTLAFFTQKICFINVHAPHLLNGKSGATQMMEAIAGHITSGTDDHNKLQTYDLIIAGDFNTGNAAAFIASYGLLGSRNLYGNHNMITSKNRSVDFILSTAPVKNIRISPVPVSDHHAVTADIDLPSPVSLPRSYTVIPNVRNPYQLSWRANVSDDENTLMDELKNTYKISTLNHCDQKGSCSRSVRNLYEKARRDGMRITDNTFVKMLENYTTDLRNSINKHDDSEWTVRRLNLKQMYIDSYLVGMILRFYRQPLNYIQNIYSFPFQRSVLNYLDQINLLKTSYPTIYQAQDAPEIKELDDNIEKAREAAERMGIHPNISISVVPRILQVFDY